MTELSLAAWLPLFPKTEGVQVPVESWEVHMGKQERRGPLSLKESEPKGQRRIEQAGTQQELECGAGQSYFLHSFIRSAGTKRHHLFRVVKKQGSDHQADLYEGTERKSLASRKGGGIVL